MGLPVSTIEPQKESDFMTRVNENSIAQKFIDVIPTAMKTYREEMRSSRNKKLSVPQFRILACLWRGLSTNNKELAEFQGVTVAAMSRMVDQLVQRGYIRRVPHSTDRRQVILVLTKSGDIEYRSARLEAIEKVANRMKKMSELQLDRLARALEMLEEGLAAMLEDQENSLGTHVGVRVPRRGRISDTSQKRQVNVKARQNQKAYAKKRQNHHLPNSL